MKDPYISHLASGFYGKDNPQGKTLKPTAIMEQDDAAIEIAINASYMAWWKIDLSTGRVTFGKLKAEMLGYSSRKFRYYKDFMSLVHPDDYENTMDAMRRHLDGSKEKYEAAYRILTKSDGYKWFYDLGSIRKRDSSGKPLIVGGFVIDQSDLKMGGEQVKMSELRYRRLFETAKDGIIILDAETGIILDVNPFLINLLGYTEDQFHEKTIWEIGFFKDIIANFDKFRELQVENYVRYENLPLETVDGRKINVEFVSNVYHENGRRVMQCNIRDITLRKKAETDYRQSEEKFMTIMENSAEALFLLDHDGKFLYSNQAATDMLGFTKEEIKMKSFMDLVPKHKLENCEMFDSFLSKGTLVAEIDTITKGGTHIHVDLNAILLPNGLVYGSCKDISRQREIKRSLQQKSRQLKEQNQLYQQLNKQLILSSTLLIHAKEKAEENDSLKTAFLQNLSHEIRTPMNGILGFSELLKNPHLSDEDQQKYIHIIEESGQRMLNIINDIVNISQIETGHVDIFLQETNVNELMRHLHSIYKPESMFKGIELNFSNFLSDELSIIETDKIKLIQIITNLLKNALKFTETGSINFGYHVRNNFLEFFVSDTGIGIKPEMHELIFERFRQVDMSIARNFEGAGLGLAISKAFIKKLGGEIWVKSELGKGSTFSFTVPYTIPKSLKSNVSYQKPLGRSLENVKILITEDDPINMLTLKKILEMENANLFFAKNGLEAFEVVKANPGIQIVLMDLKMPVMDGFMAIELIKEINQEIRIIVQSAYAFSTNQNEGKYSGCDDYIEKPYRMTDLLGLINKHVLKQTI